MSCLKTTAVYNNYDVDLNILSVYIHSFKEVQFDMSDERHL